MTGIQEIITLVTALAVLATAVLGVIATLGNRRKIQENSTKIQEVHVLADGRLSALLERVDQLTAALETSNVPVPPNSGPKS